MYLGMMFVAMVGSTGSNPIDTVGTWLPCFNRDEAMHRYRNCDAIPGGMEALHNHRDAAYRQYFSWGKYNFGGNAGRNFQAYGVHLDGTQVTGDANLVAIFDVGGGDEYPHLDIIAPDVAGTRTLLDTRGAVAASVDASGTAARAAVGSRQEDQFQGHIHIEGFGSAPASTNRYGVVTGLAAGRDTAPTGSTYTDGAKTSNPIDDGSNGTPRTGDETRMKNYSVGVASVLVLQEI
jgi:hypothetical protein